MYVAVGEPNVTAGVLGASIAFSADGKTWISLVSSANECRVGLSVQYGRGKLIVGCSNSFQTLSDALIVIKPTSVLGGKNPLICFNSPLTANSISISTNSVSLLSATRALAYSEIDARFVAAGIRIGLSNMEESFLIYSNDGISWNSAVLSTFTLSLLQSGQLTDICYADSLGAFFVTQFDLSNSVIYSSNNGTNFLQFQPSNTNYGKQVTTLTYSNPDSSIVAFSLDGENARQNRGPTMSSPQLFKNEILIRSNQPIPSASVPMTSNNEQGVDRASIARFLRYANEVFIGGYNRLSITNPTRSNLYSTVPELCGPDCQDRDVQQVPPTTTQDSTPSGNQRRATQGDIVVSEAPDANFNQSGGIIGIYGCASPEIVKRNLIQNVATAGGDVLVNGTVNIFASETLNVNSIVEIRPPQPFYAQLGSVNSFGGKITVGNTGKLTVSTNLFLEKNSTLTVSSGHEIIVQNKMVLDSTAQLVIRPLILPNQTLISIVICNYTSIEGVFASIVFDLLPNRRSDHCVDIIQNPTPTYSSNSLTVVATVSSDCSGDNPGNSGNSNQLSIGVIVGIAVGAVLVGVLVAIAIVLLTRYLIQKRTNTMNQDIRFKDLPS